MFLEQNALPKLSERIGYASSLDGALPVLVQSVKEQGFEGLVAKRRKSVYESGLRTGPWMKMRVTRGQKFVIGGYTYGTRTFDALIFGCYEGGKLIYVARTRFEFLEWTADNHLRHSKFIGLREDKKARDVVRE